MSWSSTDDLALRSFPSDFETGSVDLGLRKDAILEIGDEFVARGLSGWDQVEGTYADAFEHLATVAGRSLREFSVRTNSVAVAHDTAAETLTGLETESDQLLLDAEEALVRRDAADSDRRTASSNRAVWFWIRHEAEDDSTEWHDANDNYVSYDSEVGDLEQRVTDAEGELDGFQTQFDRIRTDEDDAHQAFADQLVRIDIERTLVNVDPSAASLESLEHLLDLFDAALLPYVDQPRSFGWQNRLALDAAPA